MNLLLDTHTFLWFINGDSKISEKAKDLILEDSNISFVSIASIWEISIKSSLGKIKLESPLEELKNDIINNGMEILPITFEHTIKVNKLEFFHRDPFDRMIISQSIMENIPIIGKDELFDKYDCERIW